MKGPRESSAGSEPPTGTRQRTWLAAASGVAAPVLSLHFLKPANGQGSLVPAEEAVLLKQTEKLRELVMAAEKGPLVDCDQILVVVDQGVVQDLLISVLPLEGDSVKTGTLRVTSDMLWSSASVRLKDRNPTNSLP